MDVDRETLERAAEHWGVELEYTDTWGRKHVTSQETLAALLAALGIPAESGEQIEAATHQRLVAEWSNPIDPALVVRDDTDAITIRIPSERTGSSVKIEIRWENDDLEHHWVWLP